MMHSASKNRLRFPRVTTNPPVALKAPFCFARADPDAYSLVELKTRKALGVEGFAFAPMAERRRVVPVRVGRAGADARGGETKGRRSGPGSRR